MRYGKSQYWQTAQERHREAFSDEIEVEMRQNETGVRKGVRVLDDGTIEHYIERV